MEYIYHADFAPEPDGGFLVTFPDVPEAITQGDDFADAWSSAGDALGLALRGYLAGGRSLPGQTARGGGLVPVPVEAATAAKLAVIEAFAASGITKIELARRIGKSENEARRILDPDYATKLPLIEAALAAMGRHLVVSVREAAEAA